MRNKLRRPLAFLLSAVMIVTMSGTPVHAVADRGQPETGLCEHHTAHTDDCGYTEETPGTPCGHEHTEDCYTKVTEYVHEHTPECYPEETEGSVSDNEATPANAEEREPVNCPHICDKESGCVTEKSDCQHEHDSECGYTESTPGTPCTYVCEICNPQDSSEADEEPETGIIKQEQCSCLTLCTEGQINPDCPVCGGSDAGLSDCKGKAAKEDAKQPEDTGICKHHQEHDDACGYQPESEDSVGSPCTYECRICPIEDLIAALPDKVTEDNAEDVRAQLDKILALFAELTEDEQEQLDLSRCYELQEALDGAKTPVPAEEILTDAVAEIVKSDGSTTYVGSLDDAFKAENSGAVITLLADVERTTKLEIKIDCTLDLGGHTITGTNNSISIVSGTDVTIQGEGGISSERSDALSVSGTVRLKGGVFSGTDGVFVESDGVLYVSGDVKIIGTVFYGLLCYSESVHLSGGTFQSPDPRNMIMPDKVLKNLLENGYAYFYNGQIPVTDDGLNGNQFGSWDYTSVMVKECSHTGDGVCEYTHTSGATTHKKTCLACGLVESAEKCSFDGIGKCSFCDAVLAVRLAADLALTYTGTAQTPAVTVTMDGQTLTAGNNYTVTYANNVNAGDTAKATVTGTAFEGTAELPFSIGKATPTVEWENDDVELTYTGQPADIKPAVTLVNGEAFSGMVTYTYGVYSGPDRPVNAGSYTVQASIPEQENYTAAKSGWMILTINKAAAPTITWPAANGLTYGQKLSESTLSGGSTEYGSFAWEKPDTVPTAGTAGHSVTFTPSNSTEQNYEPIATKTQDVDVTVAQATPTVTVAVKMSGSANSRVADLIITVAGAQNGAAPAGSITLTSDGLNETLTLQNGKAAYKWENLSDKEYTVTAAYSGDTNYKAANGQLTFDAAKKEQAALAISPVAAKTYGDPAFGLDTTGGSGTGAVSFTSSDPSIISINGSTATIHKAGTVTITARKAADNNYNEAVAAISLTIGKRPITVTADSFTVVKGAAMPTLDYQADGLVNNDTFTTDPIMTTSVSDTNTLGEYAIVISGGILTNGDSYQITYVNGKLTVTDKIPVQLTMTANPASLSGKGTVTLTISGLPSGGEATVSCSDSSINVTGGGTSWKADLPNETATYTFTANYGGDVQHSSAVATCTVSVTKQTGGGSSGGGNGNSGGSGNGGGSSSGGNGSSSGDNGSSGGGSTIVARPDETKPDTPTTSQTKPATPDKNGNVAVDNGTVQSAINTAKNDAKKNGNTANGVAVVIPVATHFF